MRVEAAGEDVLLWIKAVPGASRDELAGSVGDRLKVRISCPPEGGKANTAIRKLLADRLGVKPSQITIERGQTSPAKVVRITHCSVDVIERVLAL